MTAFLLAGADSFADGLLLGFHDCYLSHEKRLPLQMINT